MEKPWVYEIRVAGLLAESWSDWFAGLTVESIPPQESALRGDDPGRGETVLRGALPDQAALLGVLNQLQALNLSLISVTRAPL